MAVTGYFLDREWEYQEILLGFEPLSGAHSGVNLGDVVLKILHQHQITNRVLAVTADNASNNNTMMSSVQDSIQSLELNNNSSIIRVPCIAHIIQLSLKDLLGQMKANPKNEMAEMQWSDDRIGPIHAMDQQRMIVDTLNKVCYYSLCYLYFTNTVTRFGTLLSTSMLALNGGKRSATYRLKGQSLCLYRTSELAGTRPF
jgi:hypothetical protein